MKWSRVVTALAALVPGLAQAQGGPMWRSVDISRQLRDTFDLVRNTPQFFMEHDVR